MAYDPAVIKAVEEKNVVPAMKAVRMSGGSLMSWSIKYVKKV